MATTAYATELELVRAFALREQNAWDMFGKEYDAGMVDAVRRALGCCGTREEEVDRIAQLLRWRLLRRPQMLSRFDPQRGTLAAFLAGIARRWVRYQLRKPQRRKVRQRALRADVVQPPVWDGLDNIQLKECAAILSPRDRVFFWFMLDPQSNENCRLTPCERQRWHRMRVQIRSHLARQRAD